MEKFVFAKKVLMVPKTFGKIFCGLMRPKLNVLAGLNSTNKEHYTNSQTWWW